MKPEFSQKILICPISDIENAIAPPFIDFYEIHSDKDVDPTCAENKKNGNAYYLYNCTVVEQDINTTILEKLKNKRSLVLVHFDADGNYYQIGNTETPVRATINPKKLIKVITFTATLRNSPF